MTKIPLLHVYVRKVSRVFSKVTRYNSQKISSWFANIMYYFEEKKLFAKVSYNYDKNYNFFPTKMTLMGFRSV